MMAKGFIFVAAAAEMHGAEVDFADLDIGAAEDRRIPW